MAITPGRLSSLAHTGGICMSSVSSVNDPNTGDAISYAKTLLGWVLLITIVAALSRTRVGYVIVYYALVLSIVLLVLGSAPQFTDLVSRVRAPGPTQGPTSE